MVKGSNLLERESERERGRGEGFCQYIATKEFNLCQYIKWNRKTLHIRVVENYTINNTYLKK